MFRPIRLGFFGLLAILSLTMAACLASGPQYRTNAIYEEPNTSQGQMCLNQCDSLEMQCKSSKQQDTLMCDRQAEQYDVECVQRARQAYNLCAPGGAAVNCDVAYSNELKFCRSMAPRCEVDTSSCNNTYDACFNRCGGRIRYETVCVRNCEQ